jgi:predicted GIY-YIG superfamily endonuclease
MNLYILKLKEGKYYIGRTIQDPIDRIQAHINGIGSEWTKNFGIFINVANSNSCSLI